MTWGEYFIVLGSCMVTMLACRVLPLFLLKGRSLPDAVERALGFIPSAAFAALVANDLLSPGMFAPAYGRGHALVASAVVVMVAWRTKSLLGCAVAGVYPTLCSRSFSESEKYQRKDRDVYDASSRRAVQDLSRKLVEFQVQCYCAWVTCAV